MSIAHAETQNPSNLEVLRLADVSVDHMTAEMRARVERLSSDDVEMLLGLKRRFSGDLPVDPTMYEGSAEF